MKGLNRFSFWFSKKNTSLGNSDDRADQIAVCNVEILGANLELKHMFIIYSYNTGPYVEKGKAGGVKLEKIKSLHVNNM